MPWKAMPEYPPNFQPNLSAQTQKFEILKKNFLWELVVRDFIQRIC